MPVIFKIIGSGITARKSIDLTEPLSKEDLTKLNDYLNYASDQVNDFPRYVERLQLSCQGILNEAGVPYEAGLYVKRGDRDWEIVSGKDEIKHLIKTKKLAACRGPWPLAQRFGYSFDEPEGYAARILDNILIARKAQVEGDWETHAEMMFEIGQMTSTAAFKAMHERAVVIGRKTAHLEPGANRGGRAKGATAARDVRMANEYMQRMATVRLSPTALKAEIGRREGLGRSAAIEAIERGLKKLSGKPA